MEDSFVMPDFNKPLSKELKKEEIKVNKIYTPFMIKFFGGNGMFTMAIKGLHKMLITRFTRLIEIVEKVYGETESGNKFDKKNEPKDGDKKKQSWITEKWQKVIKSNFFQKTLGFLKGMASVSFITTLITFLILLRMGIIQKFLPWFLSIIESAITGLIKFIPTLLKFFWKLLTKIIPSILKTIFRTIFKMLGIENKTLLKFADFIAQWLPLLIAGIWLISTIMPIITTVAGVIGALSLPIVALVAAVALLGYLIYDNWALIKPMLMDMFNEIKSFFNNYIVPMLPYLKIVGKFLFKILGIIFMGIIKIIKAIILFPIRLIEGLYAFIIGAIAVFKTGYIVLSNIFRSVFIDPVEIFFKALSTFIIGAIAVFKTGYIILSNIFRSIFINPIKRLFKALSTFIIGAIAVFKTGYIVLSNIFRSVFIDPIKRLFKALSKAAAPVLKKLTPVINMISSLFSTVASGVTFAMSTVTKVISDLLDWIGAVSDYGIMDYKEHKQQIEASEKEAAQSIVVQAAKTDATEKQLKASGQLTAKEIQDVLQLRELSKETGVSTTRLAAAKQTGLLTDLNVSSKQTKTIQAMSFSLSKTGTFKLVEKGQ